jgi:hypothetical protein
MRTLEEEQDHTSLDESVAALHALLFSRDTRMARRLELLELCGVQLTEKGWELRFPEALEVTLPNLLCLTMVRCDGGLVLLRRLLPPAATPKLAMLRLVETTTDAQIIRSDLPDEGFPVGTDTRTVVRLRREVQNEYSRWRVYNDRHVALQAAHGTAIGAVFDAPPEHLARLEVVCLDEFDAGAVLDRQAREGQVPVLEYANMLLTPRYHLHGALVPRLGDRLRVLELGNPVVPDTAPLLLPSLRLPNLKALQINGEYSVYARALLQCPAEALPALRDVRMAYYGMETAGEPIHCHLCTEGHTLMYELPWEALQGWLRARGAVLHVMCRRHERQPHDRCVRYPDWTDHVALCPKFADCKYVDCGSEDYIESIVQGYNFASRLCTTRRAKHLHCCAEDLRDALRFLRLQIPYLHRLSPRLVTQALGDWAPALPKITETDDDLLRALLRGTALPRPVGEFEPAAGDVQGQWSAMNRELRRRWYVFTSLSVTAALVCSLRENAMPSGWPVNVPEGLIRNVERSVLSACLDLLPTTGFAVHTGVMITLDGRWPWSWDGSATHHHTPAVYVLNVRRADLTPRTTAVPETTTPSPPRGERKRSAESPPSP